MQSAPIPENDKERLESLHKLGILDTPPEERFDRITQTAKEVFNVPIALVSIVDVNRQWFKSCIGLNVSETPRGVSFCGYAILHHEPFIIPDATKDERFADNPLVIGEPHVIFYAGMPIAALDGHNVGTLCVIDNKPREFSERQITILKNLAAWAENEINSKNLKTLMESEKALKTEFDTFFNSTTDLMSIANAHGYFEKVNPSFNKLLGFTTEELLKNPFLSFIHPDDHSATLAAVERLKQGALTINFRNRFKTIRGNYLWFEWNATPVGEKLYSTARNISENKESEIKTKIEQKRMEELSHRFQFATKSAKIGVWDWDVIKNDLSWDDQMYLLYGISKNQFGGAYEAWQAGLHPDDKKSGDDAINRALAGFEEFDTSFRVIWPDKSIHYIKAYGTVIRDENLVPIRMTGVNWDITDEKKAEQNLKQFEAIIRDTDEAVISKTLDGIVTEWNDGAQKLYGYTKKEMVGKSIKIIIPPENDDLEMLLAKIRNGERVPAYKTKRKKKDGKIIDVSLTISPIYNDSEQITGASVIARDITKEIEFDRLKDEFLAVASHELRTPLTAIDGLISMILDGEYGEVNENLKQPLNDVNTSSSRLIKLVNDLLSVSRMQAHRLKFTLSEFDIKPVIDETITLLSVVAKDKGLTLDAHEIASINVQSDVDKVKQILNNLIGNSIKFTDQGGITLTTKVENNLLTIFIKDTGIGIKDEDKGKLFSKFQQLDSGKGRPVGTGLGLYITKDLCAKMGGDLTLVDSKLGVGSTFAFSMPLAGSDIAIKVKNDINKEAQQHPDQKSD